MSKSSLKANDFPTIYVDFIYPAGEKPDMTHNLFRKTGSDAQFVQENRIWRTICSGNTGEGKSYTLNQTFFHGEEVFVTSPDQDSCTTGQTRTLVQQVRPGFLYNRSELYNSLLGFETFIIVYFIHLHSLFIHFCTSFLNFCKFPSLKMHYFLICMFPFKRWKFAEMKKKYE